ncbi:hypothetical protein [Kitasatospora sp. SUK 42]|uniref:hypothetical protein n=1 Tax=Kitasatospora sp. SUK 42 TaxID=1588882 RepID=UPI0018CADA99|nr:hypothetical protein [Kitasatospora sp. SUK 42]MBV2155261.1 hypothetical protein [Kitasatospora sp. SUK 42]
MDLLTYKELETAPDTPPKARGFGHRAWHWLLSLSPTVVTFMIALSIGLCMVAVQVSLLPVLVPMAVFWGLTLIAIVGVVARWLTPGPGRHRMAS